MRSATVTAIALAGVLSIAQLGAQQPPAQQPPAQPPAGGGRMAMGGAQDEARKVPGGGVFAAGWKGKVDAPEAAKGSTVNDSKFEMKGADIIIASGPATTYWNPANTNTGDYTVSATFTEPEYMSAMSHPHPYGVFIGGNKLDTETPTLLYCAAYGNGNYIIRAFPTTFAPGGNRRQTANEAVHKAAAKGQPVTQDIKMSVKGSRVSCTINGTEVGSWDKADLTGDGKIESVEGIAGIRVAHNVDVKVSNFKVEKQ
jgi:hypothetical protein